MPVSTSFSRGFAAANCGSEKIRSNAATTDAAFFFLQQYEGLPSAQHRSTRYSSWKQHVLLESWKGSHASRKSSHGFSAEQSFYVKGPSGLSE